MEDKGQLIKCIRSIPLCHLQTDKSVESSWLQSLGLRTSVLSSREGGARHLYKSVSCFQANSGRAESFSCVGFSVSFSSKESLYHSGMFCGGIFCYLSGAMLALQCKTPDSSVLHHGLYCDFREHEWSYYYPGTRGTQPLNEHWRRGAAVPKQTSVKGLKG